MTSELQAKLNGLQQELTDHINSTLQGHLPEGKALKINHISFTLQDIGELNPEINHDAHILGCTNPIFVGGRWICTG